MKGSYFAVILIICMSLLWEPLITQAQSEDNTHFLKIGDKVPDFVFPIENYKKKKVRLSDFKGKLVILDLWAIFCGSCIAAMPHMQELQNKFDGKIQIIMVTKDSQEKIDGISSRAENVRNNKLPSAVEAVKLAGLFDYTFLPTHIWIDQNGIVKYITSGSGANEKNIATVLAGGDAGLEEKKDLIIDRDAPLLVNWFPYHKEISFYTYLAPAQTAFHSGGGISLSRDSTGFIKKISIDVASLSELYKIAYGQNDIVNINLFSNSRVFLNFKEAYKYKTEDTIDYRVSGPHFVFELINSNQVTDQRIFDYIRGQFDMAFNIKSSLEKKEIGCYVLKKLPEYKSIKSVSSQVKGGWKKKQYSTQNVAWWTIIQNLQSHINTRSPFTLVDRTGIDPQMKADIVVNADWLNLKAVNESLLPFGLSISKEERNLDCIILNDADK